MSVQLAKDEKVFKSFNYASLGYNKKKEKYDTFKNLIITNKRIIHEAVRETRGNEMILRQEMPVADAKYVKTVMGKFSAPELLVQALIFAIVAVAVALLSVFDFAEKFAFVFWILALPFVIIAVKKLIEYFASRSALVSFSIYTDHPVSPVLTTAVSDADTSDSDDAPRRKRKKEPTLEIRVNADAARKIADELGATILDAIAYTGEEEALAIPAVAVQEDLQEEAETSEESQEEND
jgi:hypothetical protein